MSRYWWGTTRGGEPRAGAVEDAVDLVSWVEDRYAKRWRSLTVVAGSTRDAEKVAEIYRHPDTGQRTWWAER